MKAESAILPGIQKPMTLWGLPIQLVLVNVCGAMTVLGFFLAIQLTPLAPFAAIGCFTICPFLNVPLFPQITQSSQKLKKKIDKKNLELF